VDVEESHHILENIKEYDAMEIVFFQYDQKKNNDNQLILVHRVVELYAAKDQYMSKYIARIFK
jgi:hypothetical protein